MQPASLLLVCGGAWFAGGAASALWRGVLGATVVPEVSMTLGLALSLTRGWPTVPRLVTGAVAGALVLPIHGAPTAASLAGAGLALLHVGIAAIALRRARGPSLDVAT